MFQDSIVILGIPVDNLALDETVARIFSMADAFDTDGRPRLAVAVKADTLMTLRALPDNRDQFSAIMNALRQADLMIPLGAPISWAARILGTSLKQRFSAVRLFRQVFQQAAAETRSLFFLGGPRSSIGPAAEAIRSAYPGVTLAGTCVVSEEDAYRDPDLEISESTAVKRINGSGADFLLIDLDDPALVRWFELNRHRLYVPVTLVISGTRDLNRAAKFKNRSRKPAPRTGIVNHIWHGLVYNHLLFALKILALVLYQKYKQAAFRLRHHPSMLTSVQSAVSRAGSGMTLKCVSMPDPLDATITEDIRSDIRKMTGKAQKIVLDFSRVNFIDSSGLGLLLGLWRSARSDNREIFLIGIKPAVYRFFKLSRTLDFFENQICENLPEVMELIRDRAAYQSFYYLAVIRNQAVVYHLFGELDASEIVDLDIDALMEPLGARDVIFNLSGLSFLDSAGTRLFLKMHRHVTKHGRNCILSGLQENVAQMFRIVHLDRLFIMADNIFSAELALRRLQINRRKESVDYGSRPISVPGEAIYR